MSQRASRVTCLVTAVLLVIATLLSGVSWFALLAALLLWPYVTAVVFLILAAGCALFRRSAPSLPFGRRTLRGPTLLLVFALVVVATLARENGYWDATISRWYASSNTQVNSTANSTGDSQPPPRLAEHPVVCAVRCDGRDRVCQALLGLGDCREPGDPSEPAKEAVKEAANEPVKEPVKEPVNVEIDAQVDSPSCFLPLYKTGRFSARARVAISHAFAGGRSTAHLDITVDGEATKLGFASCRKYLGDIGDTLAKAIVGQVNDYLAKN